MEKWQTRGINGVVGLTFFWLMGLTCLAIWAQTPRTFGWLLVGLGCVMGGACYLRTSLIGKDRIWSKVVMQLKLSPTTRALDVGCGHGLVLVKLALALPAGGHVTGIDGWRPGLNNQALAGITTRLVDNGVSDQATAQAADMRALPFADGQFNLVVSSLAIHNVRSKVERLQSLQEIARVLEPAGELIIADLTFSCQEYREALIHLGFTDIRVTGTGPDGWWGGPWLPTLVLRAIKS